MEVKDWIAVVVDVAGIVIPALLVVLGFYIQSEIRKLAASHSVARQLAEARWQSLEPLLREVNAFVRYSLFVGDWATQKPHDIILAKRQADSLIVQSLPVATTQIITAYQELASSVFSTYSGKGESAKILGSPDNRRVYADFWESEWDRLFAPYTGGSSERKTKVRRAYLRFVRAVANSLGNDFDVVAAQELIQIEPKKGI